MKLTFLLLFCSLVSLMASPTYSQNTKISLSLKNVTIEEVLNKIEDESEFYFFFNQKLIDVQQKIDIEADNKTIDDILGEILSKDIKYVVYDRQIILTPEAIDNPLVLHQTGRTITGKVTDSNGASLPGVNVQFKGTLFGVITDAQGRYTINVPVRDGILIFSFIGYTTSEASLTESNTVDIQLAEELTALSEVVVTALGIKKDAKSLGYSATSLNSDQITATKTINFGNSLSGKVAGLNVSSPPTGPGGSSKIRIRGQSSFGGDNSPLIVVNGVPINNTAFVGNRNADLGDGLQSINPDDIESMTVLKGASAAALYGFRAKDGVIIITTKSGSGQTGIGVELSSSLQIDQVLDYSDFQYEYGAGEFGLKPTDVDQARKSGTWSFGTKFDGLPSWQVDGTQKPYLPAKDAIKNFYSTGITTINSLALSGGDNNGNFRLSFSNTDAKGIIPEYTKFNKKILDLGLNYNLSEKLSLQVNANYSITNNINPPLVGGQTYNINNTIYRLANSIDPRWLKNVYKDPSTGNEIVPSRFVGCTNPYWVINELNENSKRDRLLGNILLRYQFAPWFYAQGRVGMDSFSMTHDFNIPTGSGEVLPAPEGYNGGFTQSSRNFKEVNMDFLIGAEKKIGVFGIDATFGGNSLDQTGELLSTSVTNFYIRDLYTISNGQIKNPTFSYNKKKVNSIYATVDLSYKEYLYLNATSRNDWFSTLNPESNSYLYPSISSSFLFSQAFSTLIPAWIDYGKIRVAYAEVGGDTDPYTNSLYYSINSNTLNGTPIGSISGSVNPNPNLKPLKVKETEIGLEFILLKRRISFDIAAYHKNTVDEILNVDISNTSGWSSTKVNVGRLRNQGIEMLLTLVPVSTINIRWESAFNYTYNESLVLELASGQQVMDVAGGGGFLVGQLSHEVGMPMGSLRGIDYKRDSEGRIITVNGRFLAGDLITYGSAIPKHIGGWVNTLTYKGFNIMAQVDFKAGHKMISSSNLNFLRHGLHKNSLIGREEGVVFDGVNVDGSPNLTAIEAESFYSDYRGRSIATPFVYDAGFIRWRTLSVGSDLTRFMNKAFIKSLYLNASINNFFLIKKSVDNLDPESVWSVSDNINGLELHSLPTTRTYAINLNIKF